MAILDVQQCGECDQIAIVYGSPTEYVAFFGTPIGATGFSGRYGYGDEWDLMVEGKILTYTEGQFEPTARGGFCPEAIFPRGQGDCFAVKARLAMTRKSLNAFALRG